jgi:UDP-N-acetylmuramoyl-L-alanyl-D-glutamate--2,6-diaminopimelate ligase
VINRDDPWGQRLAAERARACPVVTYGTVPGADVTADDISLAADGSRFTARTPWGDAHVRLRLLGRYNISNALAAVAACGVLGVDPGRVAASLGGMACVPGRLEEVPTGLGYQVFVDYAHTDDALGHVLATLRELTPARLLVVFGCGGNRDAAKRPLMGEVAARLADYSVVTSDNPRKEDPAAIISQVCGGFPAGGRYEACEDRRAAILKVLAMARKGDVVLVAGKGHETFQEFAGKTVTFDDRQVVRECLAELKSNPR